MTLQEQIVDLIRANKGEPLTRDAFIKLGKRGSVSDAISKCVKKGWVKTVSRGVYALPKYANGMERVEKLSKKVSATSRDAQIIAIATEIGRLRERLASLTEVENV